MIAAVLIWWLTHTGGVLNRGEVVPTVIPPHAPEIVATPGRPLYAEKQIVVQLGHGERHTLSGRDLWSAPEGVPVSCATAYIRFTWIVRDPYPAGGEDLQFEHLVPMGGGRTEVFERGSSGSSSFGYCDDLTLFNGSLQDYQVELRYASGTY